MKHGGILSSEGSGFNPLSWLPYKRKREFSDTNFEIGKPCWRNECFSLY